MTGIASLFDIFPRFSLKQVSANAIYGVLLDTVQEEDLLLLDQKQLF